MLIHAQTPPGMPEMQSLKVEIKYEFEELERGGRVRISTNNPGAVKAIHEFLRFQIKDHQTGDSGEIEN
jgi:TusA-related sulfurtransferase